MNDLVIHLIALRADSLDGMSFNALVREVLRLDPPALNSVSLVVTNLKDNALHENALLVHDLEYPSLV